MQQIFVEVRSFNRAKETGSVVLKGAGALRLGDRYRFSEITIGNPHVINFTILGFVGFSQQVLFGSHVIFQCRVICEFFFAGSAVENWIFDWGRPGQLLLDRALVLLKLLPADNRQIHHLTQNVVFVELRFVVQFVFNLVRVGGQAGRALEPHDVGGRRVEGFGRC